MSSLLFRHIAVLLMLLSNIYSFKLIDNPVETTAWNSGETLIGFLEKHSMPMSLYYDLDDDDKKISSQIMQGALTYITKDCDGNIEQALIPLNEELQIHIFKNSKDEYDLEIEPIAYHIEKKELLIEIESIFSVDVLKATKNPSLTFSLETLFRGDVDFRRLKKGDKVGIIYLQKSRMGRIFGTQEIVAAFIKNGGKKKYQFLYDGNHYDKRARLKRRDSYFIVPCRYRRISSRFSKKRWHPIKKRYRPHHGIDYANRVGTPIKATYSGRVTFVGRKGGYGKTIIIKHPNGYQSLYAHLHRYRVKKNQRVKRGQFIALMGNTGLSTGPHLHFGVKYRGRWINPARKIVIVKKTSKKTKAKVLKVVNKYIPILDSLQ
jgi:murein DD-endopeptidase MepM/ murein hydrolase activator NlpD